MNFAAFWIFYFFVWERLEVFMVACSRILLHIEGSLLFVEWGMSMYTNVCFFREWHMLYIVCTHVGVAINCVTCVVVLLCESVWVTSAHLRSCQMLKIGKWCGGAGGNSPACHRTLLWKQEGSVFPCYGPFPVAQSQAGPGSGKRRTGSYGNGHVWAYIAESLLF